MIEVWKRGLYVKVPLQECWDRTGKKPITVKWVDINKGDEKNPEYRSRLVAREINTGKEERIFVATPPLETMRILQSMAVTEGWGFKQKNKKRRKKLYFIDVRRAYFHAPARRDVYVELPDEDAEPGKCGRLEQSMYGTRDAAHNWERKCVSWAKSVGFIQGVASPCVFFYTVREISMVVHGDDFTVLGYESDLDWVREPISSEFEVKFRGRLGPEAGDMKSIRILNRIVEWKEDGIYYEADQRHIDILEQGLGFNARTKQLATPGIKSDEARSTPLDACYTAKLRALAARALFLSQDRSDIYVLQQRNCAVICVHLPSTRGLH